MSEEDGVMSPIELIQLFIKSGEFERLRREMLLEFEQSEAFSHMSQRVEEIVTAQLLKDRQKEGASFFLKSNDSLLLQEVERYPIIDRAVTGSRLRHPDTARGIQDTLQKLLRGEALNNTTNRPHLNGLSPAMSNSRGPSATASPFGSVIDRNPSMTPQHRSTNPDLLSPNPAGAVAQGFTSPLQTNNAVESTGSSNSTMVDETRNHADDNTSHPHTLTPTNSNNTPRNEDALRSVQELASALLGEDIPQDDDLKSSDAASPFTATSVLEEPAEEDEDEDGEGDPEEYLSDLPEPESVDHREAGAEDEDMQMDSPPLSAAAAAVVDTGTESTAPPDNPVPNDVPTSPMPIRQPSATTEPLPVPSPRTDPGV